MHFTTLLGFAALVSSVAAAPASPSPIVQKHRLKILVANPNHDPAFDKSVQFHYIVPQKNFGSTGQATQDPHAYDSFTLSGPAKAQELHFNNKQSLTLPKITNGNLTPVEFVAGDGHNDIVAVPYEATQTPTQLVIGKDSKTFGAFVFCVNQYGGTLLWANKSYTQADIDASNKGSPFPCGFVVIQAEKIVKK